MDLKRNSRKSRKSRKSRSNSNSESNTISVDDIQFISGKESLQEEFFHTFNSLMDKGSQIIISADRAPLKLDRVQDRIKSRLAGGLVVDIETPDVELKIKIINCDKKSFSLSSHSFKLCLY